ncbi:DNA-binding IclR family transcriptional regulator [Cupriavidus metallidurans]|jgi:DNA-binding IclR family transcriptional regulator|nr:helix-turn-helix domain-containing protein [Cupriavidus metallidurans]MDE4917938.1 helix-turn-helix domain-containing protein [Cupriavidus metallidurans]UBM12480.1 helix-turn-helix domain-containing protein [Cupriavidus metallidurans]
MPSSAKADAPLPQPGVQSLARAFALLHLLGTHHDPGLTLPELATLANIDRTTAHRMIRFLETAGYAEREPAGKRYHLGSAAMALGLRAMNRPPPDSRIVTRMKAVARLTGDAVFLIGRLGDHGHCLHTEEGAHRIKTFDLLTGTSRLLGQGTASMALMARLDNDEIRKHYNRHRAEYEQGGLSLLALLRGVDRSRKLGYVLAGAGGVAGVGYLLPLALEGDLAVSVVSAASRMPVSRRHEIGALLQATFGAD